METDSEREGKIGTGKVILKRVSIKKEGEGQNT